jgi:hypothetical protein
MRWLERVSCATRSARGSLAGHSIGHVLPPRECGRGAGRETPIRPEEITWARHVVHETPEAGQLIAELLAQPSVASFGAAGAAKLLSPAVPSRNCFVGRPRTIEHMFVFVIRIAPAGLGGIESRPCGA